VALISRIFSVFQLELSALRLPKAQRTKSLRSIPARWFAILRGKRDIMWLGRRYRFETRFEPILMHVHQGLVEELIKAGALPHSPRILDIGANTGQFGTAVLAVRPDAHIDSLEPNPACRALLEENARPEPGWHVHPFGVSDVDGHAELWFVPGRSGQGSIYRDNAARDMIGRANSQVRSYQVDVICGATLSELFPQSLDLIKVDVEGLERIVLQEVACLSWRYLLVELGGDRDGALDEHDVVELLANAGTSASLDCSFGDPASTHDVLLKRAVTDGPSVRTV
jgi:FkbM family methyltransferase